MEELKKGQELAFTGPKVEKAVTRFYEQIVLWSIALPLAKPLVFNFALGNLGDTSHVECWIGNEIEAACCGNYRIPRLAT
jgi:hypothetical protein